MCICNLSRIYYKVKSKRSMTPLVIDGQRGRAEEGGRLAWAQGEEESMEKYHRYRYETDRVLCIEGRLRGLETQSS